MRARRRDALERGRQRQLGAARVGRDAGAEQARTAANAPRPERGGSVTARGHAGGDDARRGRRGAPRAARRSTPRPRRRRTSAAGRCRTPSTALRSSTIHVVSARSGTCWRTCGMPVRALAAGSSWRGSSPGSYGRSCASSVPAPTPGRAALAGQRPAGAARRSRGRAARPRRRRAAPGPGGRVGRSSVTRPPPGARAGAGSTASSTRSIELVGRDAVGERVVGEHEAVAQHVGREVADVVRARRGVRPRSSASARAAWTRPSDARGLAPNWISGSRSARP